MNLRRRPLNAASDIYSARVRLNLFNFADPFYNVMEWEKPEMRTALDDLVKSGAVVSDRNGGWKLKTNSRGNPTVKNGHHSKSIGR